MEHRPVEKMYVRETKFVGERACVRGPYTLHVCMGSLCLLLKTAA